LLLTCAISLWLLRHFHLSLRPQIYSNYRGVSVSLYIGTEGFRVQFR
jgi:hypothetical protein